MSKTMKMDDYAAQSALESASQLPISGTQAAPLRILSRWREMRRHLRAMQELTQLDDRMLKDIGVDRSAIPRVARYGRELF